MKPLKSLTVAAVVLGLALLPLAACGDDSSEPPSNTQPRPETTAAAASPTASVVNEIAAGLEGASFPPGLADGTFLGSPDAPVTLTVFEDFLCGHCLRFTALIEPIIVEEYVVPGKVRLEFRNWPILGSTSVAAAAAAQCAAAQDAFWPYQRLLFLAHPDAGGDRDGSGYSPQSLLAYAAELDLDVDEFASCYASEETIEALRANAQAARSAGLTGTPSFLVNGEPVPAPAPSIDAWRTFLDDKLNP